MFFFDPVDSKIFCGEKTKWSESECQFSIGRVMQSLSICNTMVRLCHVTVSMFTMFTRKSNQTNMTSPIWGRFPVWLIFFKWVETTNQFTNFCRRSRPLSPYLKTSRNGAVGRWSAWCAMCGEKWEPFLEVWLKGWPGDVCVCVFLVWCCHVMLCYVMICYVMLWYVMLMLCFVMLCYVMCFLIIFSPFGEVYHWLLLWWSLYLY